MLSSESFAMLIIVFSQERWTVNFKKQCDKIKVYLIVKINRNITYKISEMNFSRISVSGVLNRIFFAGNLIEKTFLTFLCKTLYLESDLCLFVSLFHANFHKIEQKTKLLEKKIMTWLLLALHISKFNYYKIILIQINIIQ